jgi:hypothetical protein
VIAPGGNEVATERAAEDAPRAARSAPILRLRAT